MTIGRELNSTLERQGSNSQRVVDFLEALKLHLITTDRYDLEADPIKRIINIYSSLYDGLEYSNQALAKHEKRINNVLITFFEDLSEHEQIAFEIYSAEISALIENYETVKRYVPGSFWRKMQVALKRSLNMGNDDQ